MKKRIMISLMSLIILAAFLTPVIAVMADEGEPPIIEQVETETSEDGGAWDEIKEKINNVVMPVIVSLGGLNIMQLFFIITTLIKNSARRAKDNAEKIKAATTAKAYREENAELKANQAKNLEEFKKLSVESVKDELRQLTSLLTEIVGTGEINNAMLGGMMSAMRHLSNNPKVHAALADVPTATVAKKQEITLKVLTDYIAEHTEADKEEMLLKIKEAMENAKLGNVLAI